MNVKNPFVSIGYRGPEYFCDRENETKTILNALENGNNMNLFSIRRIGKTALIHHVFHNLDSEKYIPVFIDIERTESLADLSKLIIEKLATVIDRYNKKLFRDIVKWASGFGATIGLDELTGFPKIDVTHVHAPNERTLHDTFKIVSLVKTKVIVLAFDEFQQILKYPEKNTEAMLRTIMQELPNVRFLYSGSSNHLMSAIFNDPSRPFYQSTQNLSLDYINRDVYHQFIKSFIPEMADDSIKNLIDWCRGHTYYIQSVFNKVFELTVDGEIPDLLRVKTEILKGHEFYFYSIRKLLTSDQWKVLKTIALHEPVKKPTSKEMVAVTGLAPSSLKFQVEQLLEKELLLRETDGIKIYNVFLGKLLKLSK